MSNNVFNSPSEDLYLTTNIPEGSLPEFLTKALSVTDEPSQQDMLLLGTLTAASYATPQSVRQRRTHAQRDTQHERFTTLKHCSTH